MGRKSKKDEQSSSFLTYKPRPVRHFSEDFKRNKVKEIIEKQVKISELCRVHKVSSSAVYQWIYKYSNTQPGTKLVVEMESESKKVEHLSQQVADLERKVGQKQLQLDYLEKLVELASADLGYDLKKNTELKR